MPQENPESEPLFSLDSLAPRFAGQSPDQTREIVFELLGKPGHEKVRSLLYDLLVYGLGVPRKAIFYEQPVPEVHGRIDSFLGQTVFELKSDLRRERAAAEEELTRYLSERNRVTQQNHVGVATDGAFFIAYELADGQLRELANYKPSRDNPGALLVWLHGLVNATPERLPPEPLLVQRELGKDSLAYAIARERLRDAWTVMSAHPDCVLKRELWDGLMQMVYGHTIEDDEVFLQHTYLTIVAKTMAARVLGLSLPNAHDLLSGAPFEAAGIQGAVESDFFDWILDAPDGTDSVERIAAQADRFKLGAVTQDVLKGLYESLIDPSQRHDLGEYYTPDWLAAEICRASIRAPLDDVVLDPACGSGTFLFQSLRRFFESADAEEQDAGEALGLACRRIRGIDIHPVAVIIARVTYLLAIGEERLSKRSGAIRVPVYMGDSLQWDARTLLGSREILIRVPEGGSLSFPLGAVDDPATFEGLLDTMLAMVEARTASEDFTQWLTREGFDAESIGVLDATYKTLADLYDSGRDHVWGYVIRNLARPVWLASDAEKSNVIVGNPPWLSYKNMSSDLKRRFKTEAKRLGVWEGTQGRISHQDISALFFARCIELYASPAARVGMIMPMAAIDRAQFASFRTGRFGTKRATYASVRFRAVWVLDEHVQPLFPMPACVYFADEGTPGPLPHRVLVFSGRLPTRNATHDVARRSLRVRRARFPEGRERMSSSVYTARFRSGAILYPRMLVLVERVEPVGMLGGDPCAPLVASRRGAQDKAPWKDTPELKSSVEIEFLRPVYLGQRVVPYAMLPPYEGVIPWDDSRSALLSPARARARGSLKLAVWLENAERVWQQNRKSDEEEAPDEDTSLVERLDYYGQLSAQFPIAPIRVIYAASGKRAAAAILTDPRGVVDHSAYWAEVNTEDEAKYLVAILNSETVRARVEHLQARGQWGARHFHKTLLSLPIPSFDATDQAHMRLVALHDEAHALARLADTAQYFQRVRRGIRLALHASGVGQRIDTAVADLLDSERG